MTTLDFKAHSAEPDVTGLAGMRRLDPALLPPLWLVHCGGPQRQRPHAQ